MGLTLCPGVLRHSYLYDPLGRKPFMNTVQEIQFQQRSAEDRAETRVRQPWQAPGRGIGLDSVQVEELNRRFEKLHPRALLRWVFERYGERAAIGTAFGASGLVIIDIAHRVWAQPPMFTIDTGFLFPETLKLIDALEHRYGTRIERLQPELSVHEQADHYGPKLYQTNPNLCCAMRKVAPLERKLPHIDAWIVGLRRSQGEGRDKTPLLQIHRTPHGQEILKVAPMALWSKGEVWDYILSNQLDYNPLHDQGYPSIGCWPCTAKVMQDDAGERAGRWAGSGKSECGLHTFSQTQEEDAQAPDGNFPMNTPLGGRLRDRTVDGTEGLALAHHAASLPTLQLDPFQQSDFELLASGAYSPLEGFMLPEDYHGVLDQMHLENGLPFPVPVTLAVGVEVAERLEEGGEVALNGVAGDLLGVMTLERIYPRARAKELTKLLGSEDPSHPGTRWFQRSGEVLLGGAIRAVPAPSRDPFRQLRLTPQESRAMIQRRGWKSVVGAMPLHPLHRGDEYLLRTGLELTDGVLLMPLLDQPTADVFSTAARVEAMKAVMASQFPQTRVGYAGLPLRLRYFGAREAVFHALLARNYGCTHFLVPASHPSLEQLPGGVDSRTLFDTFPQGSLGITPLCMDTTVFNKVTHEIETWKTSAFDDDRCEPIQWSALVQLLERGERPAPHLMREPAVDILSLDLQSRPDYCI